MSSIFAVAIGAIIASIPFLFLLLKGDPMPVPADTQAELDSMRADIAKIPDTIAAKVAEAVAAATSAAGTDNADTLAAVKDLRAALDSATA